jgi:hypothetical protein
MQLIISMLTVSISGAAAAPGTQHMTVMMILSIFIDASPAAVVAVSLGALLGKPADMTVR